METNIRDATKKSRQLRIKTDYNRDYMGIKELFVDNKFKFTKENGILKLHKMSADKENWELFWEDKEEN